jgi:ketosteroid isomerase-like protein
MFSVVDASAWAELAAFYHPACRYERPGFPVITGVDDMLDFYVRRRPILSGRHTLDSVVEAGEHVFASGSFEGELRSGDTLQLRFADHYVFEADRILNRTTFFFTPLA